MSKIVLFGWIILLTACQSNSFDPTGKYQLMITGMKNVADGALEVVGEPDDYFGCITLNAKKQRVFELGMTFGDKDSMAFKLPGGGFLRLKKEDNNWIGRFKYFGLQAKVSGEKTGGPSKEMQSLVPLKPIGKGVISTEAEESFPCYDASNKILYFTRDNVIYQSKHLQAKSWGVPDTVTFSGIYNDSAPRISNNGEWMIFTSNRPVSGEKTGKKNLWVARKEQNIWQQPEILPNPINVDTLGDYHGLQSAKGNYYFVSYNRAGGFGRSDLYFASKNAENEYQVENIGDVINTQKSEADVYIEPEERYLLFASTDRADSYGADDIYISFRRDSIWSQPVSLGSKVNSFAYEYGAWVDQQSGYLYFNSYRRGSSDIYRVPLQELAVFK